MAERQKHYRGDLSAPMVLDEKGRCCGRKPIEYKRENHKFCHRCDRAYDCYNGTQKDNWAWKRWAIHLFSRCNAHRSIGATAMETKTDERAGFGVGEQLIRNCTHDWADARNEYIISGEYCRNCGLMRTGNTATDDIATPATSQVPQRIVSWVCRRCQEPRTYGLTVCQKCHNRAYDAIPYVPAAAYDAAIEACKAALSLLENIGTGKWAQTPAGDKLRKVLGKE